MDRAAWRSVGNPLNFEARFAEIEQQACAKTCRLQTGSSKPGPVRRCTSIASPMTWSVDDSAGSMRHPSVIPVVLRASSVRIKNKLLTHRRWEGRQGARLAAPVASTDAIVRAVAFFDSHGGRAEDHGDHGGRGSHGRRLESVNRAFEPVIVWGASCVQQNCSDLF